jgi:histidine triad (HIT) family protein
MTYDPNNVFAKILRGDLPSVKVYEDEATLAFMDIMPSVEGHVLVVPKVPAATIFDLPDEAAGALMRTAKRVAAAVRTALDCPGLMLVQLNGAAAGQSVPHVHFHILPRHEGLDLHLHGRPMVDPKTLEPVAAKIRAAL